MNIKLVMKTFAQWLLRLEPTVRVCSTARDASEAELVALRDDRAKLTVDLEKAEAVIARLNRALSSKRASSGARKKRTPRSPEELRQKANRLRAQAESMERERDLQRLSAKSKRAEIDQRAMRTIQMRSPPGPGYVPEPHVTNSWLP